jgi:hypothetical protein
LELELWGGEGGGHFGRFEWFVLRGAPAAR